MDNLIEKVQADFRQYQNELQELVQQGPTAIPQIIEAVRKGDASQAFNLTQVMYRIDTSDTTAEMQQYLFDDLVPLRTIAFNALGQSRNRSALQPLVDILVNADNREMIRAQAAKSLGELGFQEAIVPLSQTIQELTDNEELDYRTTLTIETVAALAKLGNQEYVRNILFLFDDTDGTIRLKVGKAAKYFVPEMYSITEQLLSDEFSEIRKDAIDTLFYFGSKAVITPLISATADEYADVREHAIRRINAITGQAFPQDATFETLKDQWQTIATNFDSGVCYRQGHPLQIQDIIKSIETDFPQSALLFEELRVIAGSQIGFREGMIVVESDQDRLINSIHQWWSKKHTDLTPGGFYKYGFRYDLSDIMN